MSKIYLDYAASTPCDPKVVKAMAPFFKKEFGNPSSIHNFGQKANMAIGNARQSLAEFLGCESEEIVFTGSATEADNLAIFGTVKAAKAAKPHIITSQIEHPAVLEPCRALEREGADVTYLPVNKDGIIEISEFKKALKPNTVLVSIMYANNEVGTIQPIAEIGELIGHAMSTGHRMSKILFHTDAVQAVNFLDCDVKKLGADLLTISSHKIYGPKGVGALFIKRGTPIVPVIYGGGHERGLRSGTENVAGIVGLGQAIKEICPFGTSPAGRQNLKIQNIRIRQFRDKLIKTILKVIPASRLNGSLIQRLPNNVNISFDGAEGEAMIIALDQKGIACSTGSACSSGSLEPSHVLLALGLSEEVAHGSLRLTLGKYNTAKDIEKVIKVLPPIIERLRKISGYK